MNIIRRRLAPASAAAVGMTMVTLGSGPAAAQDAFEPLGFLSGANYSYANGVSADGSVVVGESGVSGYGEAVRWVDGVLTGLGFLSGGSQSVAHGVSGDGTVVVGIAT